jgi:hypothetical protein
LFAAPWGVDPIRPHVYQPDQVAPFAHGINAPIVPVGAPRFDAFVDSIRECAVFAWSVAGINGNIASYARGIPRGEAQPPTGLPVWDPRCQPSDGYLPPENQAAQKWARYEGEKTNEHPNDRKVPYDYSRQEQLLNRQNERNAAPMAANQGRPINHASTGFTGVYSNQPQMQPSTQYSQPLQEQGGEPGSSNNADASATSHGRGSQDPAEGGERDRRHWY